MNIQTLYVSSFIFIYNNIATMASNTASMADKKKGKISLKFSIPSSSNDNENKPAAEWMSGKWGISWRNKAGNIKFTNNFQVSTLVKQVQNIPGVGYVLFGLSQGASGDQYIAPHSVLGPMNDRSCQERDLCMDLCEGFQAAGYKVLIYMATEGPGKLHHGKEKAYDWNGTTAPSVDNWNAFVLEKYGANDVETQKKAYAEVIVKEYAERYGSKVDGWWFDHADKGNIPLLHDICKSANPNAILTYNIGGHGAHAVQNNSPPYEDYTHGHPTPMRRASPSSTENLPMITTIEESDNGFMIKDGKASLGHMFMPMMEKWNLGDTVMWPEDQAVEWMGRVLKAGGAWTWNVPMDDKESKLIDLSSNFATKFGSQLEIEGLGGL